MAKRKTPASAGHVAQALATPPKTPLPELAKWLRFIADEAEAGNVVTFAAVVKMDHQSIAWTNIHDCPHLPHERAALIGNLDLLAHMLQVTEHNARMASVAREIAPPPPQAQA